MFDEEMILYFHLLNELNVSSVLDRFGHPERRCLSVERVCEQMVGWAAQRGQCMK